MSQFGNFHDFCRDSTLPVCNLFLERSGTQYGGGIDKSCALVGFAAGGGRVRNLGSIVACAVAVIVAGLLIWLSERKKAAVGRREMQIFLVAYAIVSIAEIFSVGGFLTDRKKLVWFSAIHIGAIAAACWILLINAIVGYQLMDDGTPLSNGLTAGSGLVVFIGVAYVAVDTGFNYSGEFEINDDNLRNYALYVLYLLFPLLLLVAFFILESVLVLGVLRETRPMVLLTISALLFIISQIFNFVISVHLCTATNGKIDGALFETLFVLLAVIALWFFWSSITEDEWPDDNYTSGTTPLPSTIGGGAGERAYA
ncbi:chitin synthase III catalytic subunit [Tricharina praecox]|uniref:chitin synthase III catalytic subunit n=1 Tax=Tricharina praecox TaxID=43433 RepID=UPI00221FB832|nr:chitin synthase III catalytic subunit [Tricharina praecox]KAI5852207.1 chitin synthase III catalytic subunit [Tricharina praecox]